MLFPVFNTQTVKQTIEDEKIKCVAKSNLWCIDSN